jgi:hypothetical protein
VIDVKDAEKFAEFCRQIFELLNVGEIEDGWVNRSAGSCHLALHRAATTADHRRAAAKTVFGVTDVAQAEKTLVARGLRQAARRPARPAPEFSMPLWAGTRIDQLVREVRGR